MAKRRYLRGIAGAMLAASALAVPAGPAFGVPRPPAPPTNLAAATAVGTHNTYAQSAYHVLAQALDAGGSLIEIDAWAHPARGDWTVSHTRMQGNQNNCVAARTAGGLYTGADDQGLGTCLDNLRIWLDAHPDRGPFLVKIELKDGFAGANGNGPAALDAVIAGHLGSHAFRPVDLLRSPSGGMFPDPTTAAQADNWPARTALRGKVIVELIPGTYERSTTPPAQWSDAAYATSLRNRAATGTLATAQAFPAVLNAQPGDPRTRYPDASIRPWFVVFDADADVYLDHADTTWYERNHFLVVLTNAHDPEPAMNRTQPKAAAAAARVARLAAAGASFVSTDWSTTHPVLSALLPRG